MAGIFYYRKDSNRSSKANNNIFKLGTGIFHKKGLGKGVVIETDEFVISTFNKLYSSTENSHFINNDNFIVCSGTFIYKDLKGKSALEKFYTDFDPDNIKYDNISGIFFLIIFKNKRLTFFRDYYGYYPVYISQDERIISSSFLSIVANLNDLDISEQEIYEYLIYGFYFGEQTIFKQIFLLKPKAYFTFNNNSLVSHHLELELEPPINPDIGFNNSVNKISEYLKSSIMHVVNASAGKIVSGLSGGYDSRMMLATLLNIGITPNLFVNGVPESIDRNCAQIIADSMNLDLNINEWYKFYGDILANHEQLLNSRFYFFDGLGTGGIFDDWSDYEMRMGQGFEDGMLLNGAGGEVLREEWNVPNKALRVRDFIEAKYRKFQNYYFFTQLFDEKIFFDGVEKKLRIDTGLKEKSAKRLDFELFEPFRFKAAHFIFSITNQFIDFYFPYLEPEFFNLLMKIPVKWKIYGKLQHEVISNLNKELVRFSSARGYAFRNPIPLKYKLKETLLRNIPLAIRPFIRVLQKSKKQVINIHGQSFINYKITQEYFPSNKDIINRFVNIHKVNKPEILSRILTIHYLIKKIENRSII